MKPVINYIGLLALIHVSGFAQLATLPPPSSTDGTPVLALGANAGITHWENPNTLGAYRLASDGTVALPPGLSFASTVPLGITQALEMTHQEGGAIRAIFAGETAGWINDFGYSFTGVPSSTTDSFTVFSNIQAVAPGTIEFGDHVTLVLAPGEAAAFDFWLNATDSTTTANPFPTANGGVYTVFNQTNSTPNIAPGNVKFAQSPLLVNTLTGNGYQDVPTYMVSIEDWRLDRQADLDYSDFVFGLQFFPRSGNPLDPVPEPSTYGLMGACGLLALAAWRRKKARFKNRVAGSRTPSHFVLAASQFSAVF